MQLVSRARYRPGMSSHVARSGLASVDHGTPKSVVKQPRSGPRVEYKDMTHVLSTFRDATAADWPNAWAGIEPTFQTRKSIEMWREAAAEGDKGEDAYFESKYMLDTQLDVARDIAKRYR